MEDINVDVDVGFCRQYVVFAAVGDGARRVACPFRNGYDGWVETESFQLFVAISICPDKEKNGII